MNNSNTSTHRDGSLLVRSGNVLDVRSLNLLPSTDVLIQGDRIVRIGRDLEISDDVQIIEASGLTVMPGLIDCHVHVVASTFNLGAAAKMPNVLATLRAVPILAGMLSRGFTSVRDAGGADWSLCEAVRSKIVQGPRIFAAGKALSQTGGHGDFRSRDDSLDACSCGDRLGNIGRVVDGVDACRLAVREEILKGAHQIKIMASGGVASPNDPIGNFGFSEAEIRAIVEEASNANTYVMAHAYTPKAIERAVRLGVRTIEHGNLVNVDAAKAMRDHGAFMVPTLVTYEALARDGQRLGLPAASVAKIEDVRGAAKRALEILAKEGVPMGFGSDLLGEAHVHQSEELTLRAEVLGNGTVLQQATLVGADILGRAGTLGELVPNATADILLVDGNPLLDLSCLLDQGRHLRAVIKDGRLCSTPTPL